MEHSMRPWSRSFLIEYALLRAGCLAAIYILAGGLLNPRSALLSAEEPAPTENADVFPEVVPPLPPELMARVRDSRGLPVLAANLNKVPGQASGRIEPYPDP